TSHWGGVPDFMRNLRGVFSGHLRAAMGVTVDRRGQQAIEWPGPPPVDSAEQAHGGRYQQATHQGRVQEDGERHSDPKSLDQHQVGGGEREADQYHDGGRAGDDTTASLKSLGDTASIFSSLLIGFSYPRQQEYLIVHGEAEEGAEHENR